MSFQDRFKEIPGNICSKERAWGPVGVESYCSKPCSGSRPQNSAPVTQQPFLGNSEQAACRQKGKKKKKALGPELATQGTKDRLRN